MNFLDLMVEADKLDKTNNKEKQWHKNCRKHLEEHPEW